MALVFVGYHLPFPTQWTSPSAIYSSSYWFPGRLEDGEQFLIGMVLERWRLEITLDHLTCYCNNGSQYYRWTISFFSVFTNPMFLSTNSLSIVCTFDASLLNTQHYKVQIKGQVEQSREGVAPSPTPWCSSYRKGSLRVTLDYGRQLYLLTSHIVVFPLFNITSVH